MSAEHLDRHVQEEVGALRPSVPGGEREAGRPRGEGHQPVVGGAARDAGEAWALVRASGDDPMSYGVFGTGNWGPGEIRGNAMRDLASVAAKLEMLPWDEWGPMADSYDGTTGDDFDELVDDLAAATSSSDQPELRRIYERLAVPVSMVR